MKAYIAEANPERVRMLIPLYERLKILENEKENFDRCLLLSSNLWVGMVDKEMICFWGLAPPTLLSSSAHLWLYTIEAFKGHEFLFVRQSQRVLEHMLTLYPTITGYTNRHRPKAIRWLEWLGAKFEESEDDEIPFVIHRREE